MHSAHADQTTTPDSAPPPTEYVLTFACEDRPGIVHAVTGAAVENGRTITESRTFQSGSTHRSHLRLEIRAPGTNEQLQSAIALVVERCEVDHRVDTVGRPGRSLILAAKAKHCVDALLFQSESGTLSIAVPLILVKHDTVGRLAEYHSVPFEPRSTKDSRDKAA